MPVMSGREVAEKVTELRPDVRVLYVSGYTDFPSTEQQGLEPGPAYLQKPFTSDVLAMKVREVLTRRSGAEAPV